MEYRLHDSNGKITLRAVDETNIPITCGMILVITRSGKFLRCCGINKYAGLSLDSLGRINVTYGQ